MAELSPDQQGPTVNIGEILVEIMAPTIGNGFLQPIDLIGPYPSGAPAIFIDQCAKIGGSAAMIGTVGNDDFGRINIDRLAVDGADVSAITIDEEYPTGTAFVRYRDDGTRDFVFNILKSAASRLEWSPAVDALIHRAGHLHVMGTALVAEETGAMIEKAAGIIKRCGGTISLDPNLRKEHQLGAAGERRLNALLDQCDLLLPSGEELEVASGKTNRTDALAALFQRGVSEIVLKQGVDGATAYFADGSSIHSPAFIVEELDPTGAGDCFGGAYVACRRGGMSAEEALIYANAAGARNVTFRGPMEGAGSKAELGEFIKNTGRS